MVLCRCRRDTARAAIAVIVMASGLGGQAIWLAPRAVAQESIVPSAAAPQETDPFADELNPFGTGKPPKPTVLPSRPAPAAERPRPRAKLPVPFPESDTPDEATDRRTKSRDSRQFPRSFDRDEDGRAAADRRLRGDSDGGFRRNGPLGIDDADDSGDHEPSEAEKRLAEAEDLERQGKLQQAREVLLEVVKLDPSLAVAHLALGVVLRRLGDFRGSVEACSKGIEVDPQDPELYLRRGIAWFHMGLQGIALEDFEEAAGLSYELWRGLTLIQLDRPLEAINAYASAIRRDRTCMLAYLNRGLAYLSTNEPHKAEFDFNQAIRQKPKDVRGWFNRGVAQARQKRFREAIESYETALTISPGYEPARLNLEAARRFAATEPPRQQR